MTIDTANKCSLQEPLLLAATDTPSTTDEESPIEAVRILVDAEDVTGSDDTLAATVTTTSTTITATNNNNNIALGDCGEGRAVNVAVPVAAGATTKTSRNINDGNNNNNNTDNSNNDTEDTDDEQPQPPRCYAKDFAFVLACLATIVTAGFLVGSVFLICDIIGSDPDDGDNIALLFLILCACFMFLQVYGIIRIWRAYCRDCDYKFVDCGSIYTMSSAIGFILLGPLGGLLGAGVAAILWTALNTVSEEDEEAPGLPSG